MTCMMWQCILHTYFLGVKLYKNGVLDNTDTTRQSETVSAPTNHLTFATGYPGHNTFANAAIDELHIFHQTLSDNDIMNLYVG